MAHARGRITAGGRAALLRLLPPRRAIDRHIALRSPTLAHSLSDDPEALSSQVVTLFLE